MENLGSCFSFCVSVFLPTQSSHPAQLKRAACVRVCVWVAMMWFSFLTWFQQPQVPLWSSPFPFIPPSFPPFSHPSLFVLHSFVCLRNVSEATDQRTFVEFLRGYRLIKEVLSSLTDCPSCPSLFSANEERARGCHSNPEEAQWHGPQHRGCQGRICHLKVCVFVFNSYLSIYSNLYQISDFFFFSYFFF